MSRKLHPFVGQTLATMIKDLEDRLASARAAQEALATLDVKKANFTVRLHSHWHNEGEDNNETTVTGTLKDAIVQAEQEFMKRNRRNDVQASYSVAIQVGPASISIPDHLFEAYVGLGRDITAL